MLQHQCENYTIDRSDKVEDKEITKEEASSAGVRRIKAILAAAAAQELHAHDHRGNHDHQDHDQIHNIDLTKQSSLFVDHLLQPPRL